MKNMLLTLCLAATALLCGCSEKVVTYTNPVWPMAVPDPTVIKASDGYFYAYSTQGIGPDSVMCNIQLLRSADLVNWEHLGDALPEKPKWASTTQNFWAPHVMEANGKYYLYFSAEPDSAYKKGKDLGLCLAVATSDSPTGPFVEKGEPMISGDGFINIDPMTFKDPKSGKYYIYWGSGFEPLKVCELSDDLLSFREGSPTIELVKAFQSSYQFLVEGSWLTYHDGTYYLFFSGDNCCGERAHYAVMVARSDSPTGPFEVLHKEKEGDSPILELGGRWIATGHNSIIEDDNGDLWIVYHAVDKNDRWMYPAEQREDKRVMLIDRITFEDGWPRVANGIPSDTIMSAPIIKNTPKK